MCHSREGRGIVERGNGYLGIRSKYVHDRPPADVFPLRIGAAAQALARAPPRSKKRTSPATCVRSSVGLSTICPSMSSSGGFAGRLHRFARDLMPFLTSFRSETISGSRDSRRRARVPEAPGLPLARACKSARSFSIAASPAAIAAGRRRLTRSAVASGRSLAGAALSRNRRSLPTPFATLPI